MSVEVFNHCNDDLLVVDAARVSFNKQSKRNKDGALLEKDIKLINYLISHGHKSPFFHPQFVFKRAMALDDFIYWQELTQKNQFFRQSIVIKPLPYSSRFEIVEFYERGSLYAYLEGNAFEILPSEETMFSQRAFRKYYAYTGIADDFGSELIKPADIKDITHWQGGLLTANLVTITLRIKMPIFLARQWFKHQIGFARNEVSRRYVTEEPSFFMPASWRKKAEDKKQGSSKDALSEDMQCRCDVEYASLLGYASSRYDAMVNNNIAPEQARMALPQSTYTEFIETASIADYARLYTLRIHDDSQLEIQEYAHKVGEAIKQVYPGIWDEVLRRNLHD